jgi:hypothetical protein
VAIEQFRIDSRVYRFAKSGGEPIYP